MKKNTVPAYPEGGKILFPEGTGNGGIWVPYLYMEFGFRTYI
jgi:hypothetical protein